MMSDLIDEYPDKALEVTRKIFSRDKSKKMQESLSAGPLEDLLVRHGESMIDEFESIANKDSEFAKLLGGIWKNSMQEDVWQRLKKIKWFSNRVW